MKKSKVLTFLAAGVCTLSAFAVGVQTTLKATNPKGLVFAGWFDYAGLPLVGGADFRSPSFPYALSESDCELWAKYVLPADDAESLVLDVEEEYYTSGEFDLTLDVQSLSFQKVTVSGLPSGLKFDAKNLRISGTAKKPGTYTVTAKLTNASVKKAIERKFQIVVDNLTDANELIRVTNAEGEEVGLLNGNGEKYVISVGVSEFDLPVLNAANGADKLTLSGLPSGLKYDAKTGKITGAVKKAGAYTVTATVKSGKATRVSTFTVEVKALPTWAVGTFEGCGEWTGDDMTQGLQGSVTIAANGKLTGKVLLDDPFNEWVWTAAFSASALTGYDSKYDRYYIDVPIAFKHGRQTIDRGPCRVYLSAMDFGDGEQKIGWLSASEYDFNLELWQNIWKMDGCLVDKPVFAQKTVTLDEKHNIIGDPEAKGTSTLTLVLNQNGTVSWTMLDEGVDAGRPLHDRVSGKADLIVTGRDVDGSYRATIPIAFDGGTMKVEVKLGVNEDGKVSADACEITYCDEFADWSL